MTTVALWARAGLLPGVYSPVQQPWPHRLHPAHARRPSCALRVPCLTAAAPPTWRARAFAASAQTRGSGCRCGVGSTSVVHRTWCGLGSPAMRAHLPRLLCTDLRANWLSSPPSHSPACLLPPPLSLPQPYAVFIWLRRVFGTGEHWRWGALSQPTREVRPRWQGWRARAAHQHTSWSSCAPRMQGACLRPHWRCARPAPAHLHPSAQTAAPLPQPRCCFRRCRLRRCWTGCLRPARSGTAACSSPTGCSGTCTDSCCRRGVACGAGRAREAVRVGLPGRLCGRWAVG